MVLVNWIYLLKNLTKKSKKSEKEQGNPDCECGGKRYFEDKNEHGKIVKTMCLFCLVNKDVRTEKEKEK